MPHVPIKLICLCRNSSGRAQMTARYAFRTCVFDLKLQILKNRIHTDIFDLLQLLLLTQGRYVKPDEYAQLSSAFPGMSSPSRPDIPSIPFSRMLSYSLLFLPISRYHSISLFPTYPDPLIFLPIPPLLHPPANTFPRNHHRRHPQPHLRPTRQAARRLRATGMVTS